MTRQRSSERPNFRTVEDEASKGTNQGGYYVAVLSVKALRQQGLDVVAAPIPDNPGHAEIPQIAYQKPLSDGAKIAMELLAAKLALEVRGPFFPHSET